MLLAPQGQRLHLTQVSASPESAALTSYCVVGSILRSVFQCNFSAEWVRREATEWLDKGRWFESGLCVGPGIGMTGQQQTMINDSKVNKLGLYFEVCASYRKNNC